MALKTQSDFNHYVFLQLGNRADDEGDFELNRVGLYVEEISISTSKNIASMPVPLSGIIRGESTNIALDLGMTTKNISLSGVLKEQSIKKKTADMKSATVESDGTASRILTAYEIAQLIHSYVDSSFRQSDQNFNRLFFFYPSRVDKNFNYHTVFSGTCSIGGHTNQSACEGAGGIWTGDGATLDLSQLPLLPFTFATREMDNDNVEAFGSTFPEVLTTDSNPTAIEGFIRSFSTQISGATIPSISFTLEFEVATIVLG